MDTGVGQNQQSTRITGTSWFYQNEQTSTDRGLLLDTSQEMRGGLFLSYLGGGTGTTMDLFNQQQQQGLDSGPFSTNC